MMLSFDDFKCENMEQLNNINWGCRRRASVFYSIQMHCSDCPTYIGFLDKLVKELNAHGNIGSESEKRA